MPIQVDSEIGRLRRVLIHRPGREIDWMVPSMMESLLFDDILDGDEGREEHDGFRRVIDVSGDGDSNSGRPVEYARDDAVKAKVARMYVGVR